MKITKLIVLLCLIQILSCTSDKADQLALKLEFEEYTLMNKDNISFQVLYKLGPHLPSADYAFSSEEVTFVSKIEETSKVVKYESVRKQLTTQSADIGIDPRYPYEYHLQLLSNRFTAINIKANKKYRDIEAGNSLNSCFILSGLLF